MVGSTTKAEGKRRVTNDDGRSSSETPAVSFFWGGGVEGFICSARRLKMNWLSCCAGSGAGWKA